MFPLAALGISAFQNGDTYPGDGVAKTRARCMRHETVRGLKSAFKKSGKIVKHFPGLSLAKANGQGSFPKTGCSPRNEQCVCPPGEGAGTDEMLVIENRGPLGANRKSREPRT
jgi:hypothetical protein